MVILLLGLNVSILWMRSMYGGDMSFKWFEGFELGDIFISFIKECATSDYRDTISS